MIFELRGDSLQLESRPTIEERSGAPKGRVRGATLGTVEQTGYEPSFSSLPSPR
ncbi:MAG: hypothetical protein ACREFJ_14070 [Acetobacteraceae bacterium]